MSIINNRYMKLWKTIGAVGTVTFLSAALGVSFSDNSQHLRAAKNYALTESSATTNLRDYFKSGYSTKTSLQALLDTTNPIKTKCEDVLNDAADTDACLLAISLYNSDDLNENLTYDPSKVKTLNLSGTYLENDWNSMSTWLQRAMDGLSSLKSITISDYKGTTFLNLSNQQIEEIDITKANKDLDKSFLNTTWRSLKKLNFVESEITSLSDVYLHRFSGLETLNLSKNKITQLHYTNGTSDFKIGSLTNLEFLNLSENKITDTTGFFNVNVSANQFRGINLSMNEINPDLTSTAVLRFANSDAKVDLSDNDLTSVDFFFKNISFDNRILSTFRRLGEVDLSSNKLTTLPGVAAKISRVLDIEDNAFNKFSQLSTTSMMEQLILKPEDLDKEIWSEDIYNNGKVTSIKNEYFGWLVAPGKRDDENQDTFSTLQSSYIKDVLLETGIKLYNIGLLNTGQTAQTTLEQLTSTSLKDGALSLETIMAQIQPPKTQAQFNNAIIVLREQINTQIIQSHSNYKNYLKTINKVDSNTNTTLTRDQTIIVIVLSVIGLIIAAGFTGFYFFRSNNKRRKSGEF